VAGKKLKVEMKKGDEQEYERIWKKPLPLNILTQPSKMAKSTVQKQEDQSNVSALQDLLADLGTNSTNNN